MIFEEADRTRARPGSRAGLRMINEHSDGATLAGLAIQLILTQPDLRSATFRTDPRASLSALVTCVFQKADRVGIFLSESPTMSSPFTSNTAFHPGFPADSDLQAALDVGIAVGVVADQVMLRQQLRALPDHLDRAVKSSSTPAHSPHFAGS